MPVAYLGFFAGLASASAGEVPFKWLHKPHWPLAVCIVLLVAAALEARTGRRQAILIAGTAGVIGAGGGRSVHFCKHVPRWACGGIQFASPGMRRPPATTDGACRRSGCCRCSGRACRRTGVRCGVSARRSGGHGADHRLSRPECGNWRTFRPDRTLPSIRVGIVPLIAVGARLPPTGSGVGGLPI